MITSTLAQHSASLKLSTMLKGLIRSCPCNHHLFCTDSNDIRYKNVDESQWAVQHEKWRRIEQVEKNPNSRENLLKKLDELKRKKIELLKKYKASKETCDRLQAKIYNARSSKDMRNTGDAFLKELDGKSSKVEEQLAVKAMPFGSTKIASSSHLTLSVC